MPGVRRRGPGGARRLDRESDARFIGNSGFFSDDTGSTVTMAGDIDGDGLDDVLLGASGNGVGGAVYLLQGPL